MPAGPAGSPTSLLPDGRPSRRVRRSPEGSTIEMRPLCGIAVPVSDTSRLPWFESAIPIGRLSPDVTVVPGHNCALASTTVSIGESGIITTTFALTVHLPMRAILLDRTWVIITTPLFQPVLCVDGGPGGLRAPFRFGLFAVCGTSVGCGSVECNESQL